MDAYAQVSGIQQVTLQIENEERYLARVGCSVARPCCGIADRWYSTPGSHYSPARE